MPSLLEIKLSRSFAEKKGYVQYHLSQLQVFLPYSIYLEAKTFRYAQQLFMSRMQKQDEHW